MPEQHIWKELFWRNLSAEVRISAEGRENYCQRYLRQGEYKRVLESYQRTDLRGEIKYLNQGYYGEQHWANVRESRAVEKSTAFLTVFAVTHIIMSSGRQYPPPQPVMVVFSLKIMVNSMCLCVCVWCWYRGGVVVRKQQKFFALGAVCVNDAT